MVDTAKDGERPFAVGATIYRGNYRELSRIVQETFACYARARELTICCLPSTSGSLHFLYEPLTRASIRPKGIGIASLGITVLYGREKCWLSGEPGRFNPSTLFEMKVFEGKEVFDLYSGKLNLNFRSNVGIVSEHNFLRMSVIIARVENYE